MTLFDDEAQEYVLFDSMRMHVVLRQNLTSNEAEGWNERLVKSRCGNLQWKKGSEVKTRVYKI